MFMTLKETITKYVLKCAQHTKRLRLYIQQNVGRNVANNQLTGWIPDELKDIKKLE